MKTALIETCRQCKEIVYIEIVSGYPTDTEDRLSLCWKAQRIIKDEEKIPEWCPLPDSKL